MSELTLSIAAEINSALQTIIGHCDLLERGYPDPNLQRDLATVVRQAQRIAELLGTDAATPPASACDEAEAAVTEAGIPSSPEAFRRIREMTDGRSDGCSDRRMTCRMPTGSPWRARSTPAGPPTPPASSRRRTSRASARIRRPRRPRAAIGVAIRTTQAGVQQPFATAGSPLIAQSTQAGEEQRRRGRSRRRAAAGRAEPRAVRVRLRSLTSKELHRNAFTK